MNIFRKDKDKKGNVNTQALIGVVIGVAILAVVSSLTALTLAKVGSQLTSGTIEYNATAKGSEGIKTVADFIPVVAIAGIMIVLVAGFVAAFFIFRGR